MAGNLKERLPRQIAEHNIGSSHLTDLLKRMPKKLERPFIYAPIANHIAEAGVRFPLSDELVGRFKLDILCWISSSTFPETRQSLPLLFIGKIGDSTNYTTTDFEDATATIEIGRKMQWDEKRKEMVPTPFALRIAGVTEKGRIVAATYDLNDNNRLTKLNVSLSIDEVLADLSFWYQNLGLFTTLTVNFPTQIAEPYETAGLVTQAMYEGIKKIMSVSALTVQITPHQCLIGKPSSSLEERTLNEQANALGYGVDRTNVGVSVGLTREAAERRGVAPWEISLPEFLSKA